MLYLFEWTGSEKKMEKVGAINWDTHNLQTNVKYFQRSFYIIFIRIKGSFNKKMFG